MDLGFVDTCLRGGLEEKLALAEREGLWIEIAHTGSEKSAVSVFENYDVPVKTVQAYLLHRLHWLSPDRAVRKAAEHHVLDTIGFAEKAGAQSVLTVPTYGFTQLTQAKEECMKNYRRILKETSLNILVEQLSPVRTSFLPSPADIAKLISETGHERLKMVVDTLHLRDSGFELHDTTVKYSDLIWEIHLRDNVFEQGGFTLENTVSSSKDKLVCLELEEKSMNQFTETVKKVIEK